MRFAFIQAESKNHSVAMLAKVMKVSRSGYYAWLNKPASTMANRRKEIKQLIYKFFLENDGIYGAPKITDHLWSKGYKIAIRTVSKYMKELGIRSVIIKKFKASCKGTKEVPYDNLLNQDFNISTPNKAWATDITYIWTKEDKWVYLASVMDLFSRKIIGYAVSQTMDVSLVETALKNAIITRDIPEGVIHHSDRGSQYT